MEIVLLRHGRPRIDTRQRMNAAGFGRWISAYGNAGLDPSSLPPQDALMQAKKCAYALCSDLPRSFESAAALGLAAHRDGMFRELGLPHADWRVARLPPGAWAVLFRLLWLAGYAHGAESVEVARARARGCAERLMELAAKHGKVMFVGHGSLNWLIAGQLKRKGWDGPVLTPARHWSFGVYRYR